MEWYKISFDREPSAGDSNTRRDGVMLRPGSGENNQCESDMDMDLFVKR